MEKKTILSRIKLYIAKTRAKKKREYKRKIITLFYAAYDYYLTLYLLDVQANKKIDLPVFMYLSGDVVCKQAAEQALKSVIDNAISLKRVNKCYKSYLNYRSAILKGC